MRVSNAEQFRADAISVEPDLFHSTGNPGSDFAEDEFNHKPLGSVCLRTTPGSVQMWQKVAEAGGAGDWRLIN